MKVQKTYLKH